MELRDFLTIYIEFDRYINALWIGEGAFVLGLVAFLWTQTPSLYKTELFLFSSLILLAGWGFFSIVMDRNVQARETLLGSVSDLYKNDDKFKALKPLFDLLNHNTHGGIEGGQIRVLFVVELLIFATVMRGDFSVITKKLKSRRLCGFSQKIKRLRSKA